ncbi:phosphoribosyltransferase [Motilibacter sp. E257]|uniref:Phosphoribosyltransferase n=1 Tax=Motilibacter deserti TaxID=2714956 RepID=A0ABX0GTK7_9ACTN|nr:phosphoribosyltransferase [Motilibacter deserti]
MRTTGSALGLRLEDLLGLALRRNPRRAHLLVSRVLGKHVPTDPRLVDACGLLLGRLVARTLAVPPSAHGAGATGVAATEAPASDAPSADAAPADSDVSPAPRVRPLLAAALSGGQEQTAELWRRLRSDAPPEAGAAEAPSFGAAAPVVLGFAETATALGHCVADALGAAYLHSTRRSVPGLAPAAGFEEEHSHATSHALLPADPGLLAGPGPLVLVDDELSTGQTALNTLAALHREHPRDRYVVAALVDLRTDEDRERLQRFAAELGASVEVVALAVGEAELPAGLHGRAAELLAQLGEARSGARAPSAEAAPAPKPHRLHAPWPAGLPEGGRHGFGPGDRPAFDAAVAQTAKALQDALGPVLTDGGRVLVLGSEELLYAPLRIAAALAERIPAAQVRFSSTTRSPVLAVDDPGYAIRTALTFPSSDDPADGPGPRYAYNVVPGAGQPDVDAVVLVVDEAADTPALHAPDGLLAAVAPVAAQAVLLVLPTSTPGRARTQPQAGSSGGQPGLPRARSRRLPSPLRGPQFGSYAADEVGWLLTDLSGVPLEAPVEEREEAIQSGGAHYAESLPVEYQPTAAYQQLFAAALDASAGRLAHAVGVVTETVLAERGRGAVLVSLARAGTPVGVLMRRWALARGVDLPHYSASIVRGRGIDEVALRWLAASHRPEDVVFVDGWTGKGAIARELQAALDGHAERTGVRFDPGLAVLADPGRCVEVFGTRDDFLIPSACLNSTVSGLVSRTVLNTALIGPDDFHGAKFYAELAGADVSARFVDAVSARFDEVRAQVERDWPRLAAADRAPTWEGWAAVERVSADYGIHDVNLVKPGVGETTRVLLRRVPWRVLVRRDAEAGLAHVLLLAEQRGVPVEVVDGLPYSCVGLIHPRYTRGATGADGRVAAGAEQGATA